MFEKFIENFILNYFGDYIENFDKNNISAGVIVILKIDLGWPCCTRGCSCEAKLYKCHEITF